MKFVYEIVNLPEMELDDFTTLQDIDHALLELLSSDTKLKFNEDGITKILKLIECYGTKLITRPEDIKNAIKEQYESRWFPISFELSLYANVTITAIC